MESYTSKKRRDNLQIALERSGVKDVAFAEFAGISAGYLSQLKLGRLLGGRNMGEKTARKMEKCLRLPLGWFDQDNKATNETRNVSKVDSQSNDVPLIAWIQAGSAAEAIDIYQPGHYEMFISCPVKHGTNTYALRVEGDSMSAPSGRSYPHGSIIYVDPDRARSVCNGDRIIARISGENEVTFKCYIKDGNRQYLKPLNSVYPLITEEFEILGVIIGMFMKD